MAGEKTNLKDRLKKTQVGVQNPAAAAPTPATALADLGAPGEAPPIAAPSFADPVAPPIAPPIAAPAFVPGIPGLGDDIAPPPIVQQQQAAEAAARRAQAVAADPFGAAVHVPQGPQEVRLVIDEKPVDDKEVGRGRGGSILAIVIAAAVGIGAGFGLGNLLANKNFDSQTTQAMTNVRREVSNVETTLGTARQRIDHALDLAGIQMTESEEGGQQAPQRAPQVDEELITWFQGLPNANEAPFGAGVYAGRVGRLRPNIVEKLSLLTLQIDELWRQLGEHVRRTRPADVRTAIENLSPTNATNQELARLVVIFARNPQNQMTIGQLVGGGTPNPAGLLPITGPGIPPNTTRTPFTPQSPALTNDNIITYAFPLGRQGIPAQYISAAREPFDAYSRRLRNLRLVVDGAQTTHRQLTDLLAGRRPQ